MFGGGQRGGAPLCNQFAIPLPRLLRKPLIDLFEQSGLFSREAIRRALVTSHVVLQRASDVIIGGHTFLLRHRLQGSDQFGREVHGQRHSSVTSSVDLFLVRLILLPSLRPLYLK